MGEVRKDLWRSWVVGIGIEQASGSDFLKDSMVFRKKE